MHLIEVLKPEMVWSSLEARTKSDVLRELSGRISKVLHSGDEATILKVLEDREALGSTGIQDGIAIPHGKVPGIERMLIACGRSRQGIDFDAHDAKPTHIFFVLLAPEFAAGQHLKALARLSRMLKDPAFRERLLSAEDDMEIYNAIMEEDQKI